MYFSYNFYFEAFKPCVTDKQVMLMWSNSDVGLTVAVDLASLTAVRPVCLYSSLSLSLAGARAAAGGSPSAKPKLSTQLHFLGEFRHMPPFPPQSCFLIPASSSLTPPAIFRPPTGLGLPPLAFPHSRSRGPTEKPVHPADLPNQCWRCIMFPARQEGDAGEPEWRVALAGRSERTVPHCH